MLVSSTATGGLDAAWGTKDLVNHVDQCAHEEGAAAHLKGGGLTGLVALTALGNFAWHQGTAIFQFPLASVVELGRLVGMDFAKESEYGLKRVALHVVRAWQFALLALGSAVAFCTLTAFVKSSYVVSMHHLLGFDVPWEKTGFSETGDSGEKRYWASCVHKVKELFEAAQEMIGDETFRSRLKVGGALAGAAMVIGAGVWGLVRYHPDFFGEGSDVVDDDSSGGAIGDLFSGAGKLSPYWLLVLPVLWGGSIAFLPNGVSKGPSS